MVNDLINKSKHPQSGFYLDNLAELTDTITELEGKGQKTILFGVTYALLDLAKEFPQKLEHTIIMETGGMKGKGKELLKETIGTLEAADQLSEKDRKSVAKYVFAESVKSVQEIEGLPIPSSKVDKIILRQINQATKKRQKAISKLEDKDPKWIKTALVESFLLANCGKYGEKIYFSTVTPIQAWIRENLSDKELKQFEKKFGL